MISSPTAFLEFIWSGQNGWFELAAAPDKRKYFEKHEALSSLAGKRYFAPLARWRHGSTKADVAPNGNILWADIDSLDGLDRIADRLEPIGLVPSATVFSGMKGYWVYLKLTEPIPTADVEILNKRLAALLDADHCWNRDRIARLPGSIHKTSGKLAEIVEFSAIVYDPADLEALPALPTPTESTEHLLELQDPRTPPPGFPKLSRELWNYIDRHPQRGESYDRSVEEQRIFLALVTQGWSDQDILSFANYHRLPRHLEEAAKQSRRLSDSDLKDRDIGSVYRWTLRSISKARLYAERNQICSSLLLDSNSPMCMQSVHYRHASREEMLMCVKGQATSDLVKDITQRTGCSERTARRGIKQLATAGYIERNRVGKRVYNELGGRAHGLFNRRFRPALWLPHV